MQGDVEQKRYSTVTNTGRALVAEKGVVQGLFRGLGWRIALISSTFFLVNKLKGALAPVMFPTN
jgi:solute carrier family 25 carnitine/acylcarnitine transporter 20/29